MIYGVVNYQGFGVKDEVKPYYALLLLDLQRSYLVELVTYSSNALLGERDEGVWIKTFTERGEALEEVRRLKEEREQQL